ncbi:YdeI/OmpD-associated family protein [Streptomyces sp. NPDC049906]|uniref:YdeI/OmpD-associated family protein n=1 Tax=Streptomyces sp. NPDC049906 TaxID=3155656 RepID=UPI00342623B0
MPSDLAAALDADPRARAAFEALDGTGRYLLVLPLLQARTPETGGSGWTRPSACCTAATRRGRAPAPRRTTGRRPEGVAPWTTVPVGRDWR